MKKGFDFRGLEIHCDRMFDYGQVLRNLDFMERYGLNTLIFHKNELLDMVVFPEKFFSMQYMWDRFAPRYSRVLNHRYYINTVIEECHRRGIQFMMEVKEIYFDEWIVELHPEVLHPETHRYCPCHPFWWEYLEAKMDEFLEAIPNVDGVIVSPATRESKISISANKCGCDECKNADDAEWYATLLRIMNKKLAAKGKKLAVRDFAFSASDQTVVLDGANRAGGDIVIALKNTPHDYYPTFPTNAAIGKSGHDEWIEFDTWGQFIGNGVFPVSLVEDMKERMQDCHALGATGIWLRTDWENMDDHCSFNSPNVLNVIAGAMLSQDIDTDIDEIYKEFARYGVLSPLKSASFIEEPTPLANPERDFVKLRDFMKACWKVMEKTVFARGLIFQDNSMFPYTMERCFAIMLKIHSRSDWDPGADRRVDPTVENLEAIFAEKRAAVEESQALAAILEADSLGLPEYMAEDLKDMIDLYTHYTRAFELSCKACFSCRLAETTKDPADRQKTLAVLEEIKLFQPVLRERVRKRTYTHEVWRMLDAGRFDVLLQNVGEHLAAIDFAE